MTPKIVTIIGTRPQLIKVSPDIQSTIINTGQHFDYEMNEEFICSLGLKIDYTLNDEVALWSDLYDILSKISPDIGVVYGDTSSTLLGAEALWQRGIPFAHIEAGVRCFRDIPEERIRIEVDKKATWRFCPTPTAVMNLEKEGIFENVYLVGDVLYDRYINSRTHKDYMLLTVHRADNLKKEKLETLFQELPDDKNIIFPVHPHTRKVIKEAGIVLPLNIMVIPPVGYKEMQKLIKEAEIIYTDSGGIQREAFFYGTPCEVLRKTNEWPETQSFGFGNAGKRIYKILIKEWGDSKCQKRCLS